MTDDLSNLKPVKIEVSEEEFRWLVEQINKPPKKCEKFERLLNTKAPWENE